MAAMGARKGARITRVYTKTGDDGTTGLVGGQRVRKDSARIESYGTVDELSAALGIARLELESESQVFGDPRDAGLLGDHLRHIQNQLFTLGGDLATRIPDRHPMMPVVTVDLVNYLERVCDAFNGSLAPLTDFILPGGSRTSAALHAARTICRRAERAVLSLAAEEDTGPHALVYLNRLSDALFVLARWANARMNVPEFTWDRKLEEPAMPGEEKQTTEGTEDTEGG